jgi:phosphoglycerate dehydrogenase-like enzyme
MAAKLKVLLDPVRRKLDEIFSPDDRARLDQRVEVIWGRETPIPDDVLAAHVATLDAIVTGQWHYGSVDQFPRLRAILEVSGRHPSPKQLEYDRCFARAIRVLSCAPAFGPAVAEMALGMALACSRQIVDGHTAFVAGEEHYSRTGNVETFSLYGQPVGFIGYGGLARSLRPLLAPFGCSIQVYDPWLPVSYLVGQGVQPAALEELLASCRVIFVLAIPSSENRALLDRALLERIQPDAVLVVISRSHLVDFDALTDLLYQRRFRAAIDVFPQEPLPADHSIRHAPGVVLSAHRAGSVASALQRIGHMVVDDLEAISLGLPPLSMQSAQPETIYRLE